MLWSGENTSASDAFSKFFFSSFSFSSKETVENDSSFSSSRPATSQKRRRLDKASMSKFQYFQSLPKYQKSQNSICRILPKDISAQYLWNQLFVGKSVWSGYKLSQGMLSRGESKNLKNLVHKKRGDNIRIMLVGPDPEPYQTILQNMIKKAQVKYIQVDRISVSDATSTGMLKEVQEKLFIKPKNEIPDVIVLNVMDPPGDLNDIMTYHNLLQTQQKLMRAVLEEYPYSLPVMLDTVLPNKDPSFNKTVVEELMPDRTMQRMVDWWVKRVHAFVFLFLDPFVDDRLYLRHGILTADTFWAYN